MNYFYLYLLPQPKYANPRLEIIGSYQILVKTGRVLCVYNKKRGFLLLLIRFLRY